MNLQNDDTILPDGRQEKREEKTRPATHKAEKHIELKQGRNDDGGSSSNNTNNSNNSTA